VLLVSVRNVSHLAGTVTMIQEGSCDPVRGWPKAVRLLGCPQHVLTAQVDSIHELAERPAVFVIVASCLRAAAKWDFDVVGVAIESDMDVVPR
jgi:hypothetical protein